MKCKRCGKPVVGKYVEVAGAPFHPGCFTCARCKEMIIGAYQKQGKKYYHPVCYKEKIGLLCEKCGKVLVDSWVEHKGKKYHPQCLQLWCDICRKEITGEYMYDREGKYHKQCFLNHKAPQCGVCDQPIVGKYLKDEWGNRSHETHDGKKTTVCNYCSRIISFPTSNGGYTYSDGRLICGICKFTAVTDEQQVRVSLSRVLKLLAAPPAGFNDIPKNIPLQLVDKPTLKKLGASRLPDHGEGLTRSNIILQNKKPVKTQYEMFLLFGMPQLEFEAVLAHELLHAWLIERNIKRSKKDTEGFCNLGSALVYKTENSRFAQILLKRLENNPDRLYGKGYRKMNDKLQQWGWQKLKTDL